jgi:hypothetical protein
MARFSFREWLFRRKAKKAAEARKRRQRSRFLRPWFEPLEQILAPGSILNRYTALGSGWFLSPGFGIPDPVDGRHAASLLHVSPFRKCLSI